MMKRTKEGVVVYQLKSLLRCDPVRLPDPIQALPSKERYTEKGHEQVLRMHEHDKHDEPSEPKKPHCNDRATRYKQNTYVS